MKVERQKPVPIIYDGQRFEIGFRLDLLVDDAVIVEVKAIAATLPVHEAQLLTYMRMSGMRKGLLLNFNAYPFPAGIKRMVL
jgi:GxxExxY protein